MRRSLSVVCLILVAVLTMSPVAFAKSEPRPEKVGKMSLNPSMIQWDPVVDYESVVLTIQTPDNRVHQEQINSRRPQFNLRSLGKLLTDGTYTYQLRVVPRISQGTKDALAAARAAGNDEEVARISREAGLTTDTVQVGAFSVVNGAILVAGDEATAKDSALSSGNERQGGDGAGRTASAAAAGGGLTAGVEDQVIPDDLIVQGSGCFGFDCVDGESFGFDTVKLKENNLRIKYEDTSTSAGYPANDWELAGNDSTSGGANYFSINDTTNAKVPFLVEANSPTSSVYVDSSGKVGFRQAAPLLDLHVTTGDTPAMRLEQTNSGGFTAQTWDVGGNEANFFVRDLTGGSRLSFRIRPGAPTSSIDIAADGDVGVGTASPQASSRMDLSDSTQLKARLALTGQEYLQAATTATDGIALLLGLNRTGNRQLWIADTAAMAQNAVNTVVRIRPAVSSVADVSALFTNGNVAPLTLNRSGGNVGVGATNPAQPFQVGESGSGTGGNGAHVTTGGTWTNGSSREFKEHIEELSADEARQAVAALKPVRYNYKAEPDEHYVGFIAEDVPELVAQTSTGRQYLSPMDIVATLTKVVQDQQKTIDELTERLDSLEKNNQ